MLNHPNAPALCDIARRFLTKPIYSFTEEETEVLDKFFTNLERRVFFMHTLPAAVGDVVLAMYSRLKNPRGLRGLFVDTFLPQFLATNLPEVDKKYEGKVENFLKDNRISSLAAFLAYSGESRKAYREFFKAFDIDPRYIQKFAESTKVKKFLRTWLDKYGHNSIARMANLWLCFEQVSILAAKSLEWNRPGFGAIELSTRYVDMSGKDYYPIDKELEALGIEPKCILGMIQTSFEAYSSLQGSNFTGPFPRYLRERFGSFFAHTPADLETGVVGETCDVLGNFLPAATLTSVGIAVSGEGFPELLKHLLLDATPENVILVEMVMEESKKLGANQFVRHTEPTPWKIASWEYLREGKFLDGPQSGIPRLISTHMSPRQYTEGVLLAGFRGQESYEGCKDFDALISALKKTPRGEFDKLPNHFEKVSASFAGVMSFRGWRDLHRQGFCTHYRTLLSPNLGFYEYDKPAPKEFAEACEAIHRENLNLYRHLQNKQIPKELCQYPLALGNMIGFDAGANFGEWEFCNWQRLKYAVNHEVRQVFLAMEQTFREHYPWWQEISRADTTRAYIFARGEKGIPLPD
jgi:hypothetical protein